MKFLTNFDHALYLVIIKYHFMVFHVDIKKGCKRKFLASGEEVEPDFGSKQKVNTGYLMSSYSEYYILTWKILGLVGLIFAREIGFNYLRIGQRQYLDIVIYIASYPTGHVHSILTVTVNAA